MLNLKKATTVENFREALLMRTTVENFREALLMRARLGKILE
ncbi:MAG: hypothetical protein NZX77_00515 [Polyangiaceae bacterium]|nr:hypothetical protein [Polyangiaceae bacterium]